MAKKAFAALILAGTTLPASSLVDGPWSDRAAPPEERAKRLIGNMSLDEKLALLRGNSGPYVGNVAGNKRLGIPPITMNDGPQGFRDEAHKGTSTAFPSGLTVAATWDPEAVEAWGAGMGKEFYDKGSNVQLGPGLCLARVPRNGRNFEYLAGEDPFLGYVLAKASVAGIQSQKVVANAKHWVANSQETNRGSVSEGVDERTRFEMYYPPFMGAIEAGVGSFMCSYNKIDNIYSCENPQTLRHELKEILGFKGYVMSDWGATHTPSIMEGLDMEMPGQDFMNPGFLKPGIVSGAITQEAVDDSALRILAPMFAVGVMDEPVSAWDSSKLKANVTSKGSLKAARTLSALSTVLLKNEGGVLPLPRGKRLALLGLAGDNAMTHGQGSGRVDSSYLLTPLAGLTAAAGAGSAVVYDDGTDVDRAARLAATADYAIVFVGTSASEGSDRGSLSLGDGQDALVEAAAKANPRTIVVASVPGAVLLPWADKVPAVLTNFMPGQQAGGAIADVLFGDVNPSGKLPLTFPMAENETELAPIQWPGLPSKNPAFNYYTERLLVGYRYYDAHGISPRFPFGHGLSYTRFRYDALAIEGTKVTFTVENAGPVAGAEVAQLYLRFPKAAEEPPSQLKGFKKTRVLKPGEVEHVEMELVPRDLSIWDVSSHNWAPVPGVFVVMVGSSSRDLPLKAELKAGTETYI